MLQFAQDGEFYYRSGSSKLEKNDLTGAIASYRMALKLDPKNYDAVLGIAEILTAMGRTEESNRLLMVKFREEERPAEAYFGMGCNFFAQREYDQARMSFDKYLDEDPEGEFAYTAYDMAEAIDDGTAQAYQEGSFAVPGYTEAEQARRLMEKEDFKGAIELLEIRESDKAMEMWLGYCDRYEFLQKPFEGMGEILQDLKDAGLRLGIVTSRTRDEFKKSVERYDFIRNFEVIICADDTKKHKPAPEPILAALDKMQIAPSRALYVGDSSYDMACAKAAGADGALALWGAHEVEKIPSVYRLKAPGDISRILTQDALHSA